MKQPTFEQTKSYKNWKELHLKAAKKVKVNKNDSNSKHSKR